MDELRPYFASPNGTVVEVGSRDGHDAKAMAEIFQASRVVTIEANPLQFNKIQHTYPMFENYNCAITNSTGPVMFYAVRSTYHIDNIGQSSTKYRDIYDSMADKITVKGYTMDEFTEMHNITSIEAMKIDVEGATYEVLEGFSKLRMTRLLHIESEHKEFWPGQKLYGDVARFMEDAGYEQVYFAHVWDSQSDTIWLRKD